MFRKIRLVPKRSHVPRSYLKLSHDKHSHLTVGKRATHVDKNSLQRRFDQGPQARAGAPWRVRADIRISPPAPRYGSPGMPRGRAQQAGGVTEYCARARISLQRDETGDSFASIELQEI
ncbi:hypothetical protein GCM10011326_47490 [Salipiger profundus]|nr:hypothetical protein GCM10011326_47490 [Salipiger profundus]